MDGDNVFYLVLIIFIVIGLLLKRKLKIHALQSIGKKVNKVYHSVPLWIRYLILISIPFAYIVAYEYYHPQ